MIKNGIVLCFIILFVYKGRKILPRLAARRRKYYYIILLYIVSSEIFIIWLVKYIYTYTFEFIN